MRDKTIEEVSIQYEQQLHKEKDTYTFLLLKRKCESDHLAYQLAYD